ncbi:TonB dependent receptor [compost metagenome]
MDGWVKNVARPVADPLHPGVTVPGALAGDRTPGNEEYSGRLALVWRPSEDFSADLRLLYSSQEINTYTAFIEPYCTGGVTQPTVLGNPDLQADCRKDRRKSEGSLAPVFARNYTYGNNGVPHFSSGAFLGSLTLEKQFGDISVTSITGVYDQSFWGTNNADYSSFAAFWGAQNEDYNLFTQEVRLNTDFDGKLNFSAGAYYETFDREFGNYPSILHAGLNVAADNYTSFETVAQAEGNTLSAFGQVRWQIADGLELAAGARYSRDEKSQDAVNRTVGVTSLALRPAGSVLSSTFEDENVSPEATLSWKFAPRQMVYAGYKSGYKAGAISNGALLTASATSDSLVVGSEVADGFEVGYKGDMLANRLRLNAVAYSYDFEDLQLGTLNAATLSFIIQNAAAARTQGFTGSLAWLATDRLTLNGNVGYNRARYTRFTDAQCYTFQTAAQGCVGGRQDLTGEQLTRAPELSAMLGFNYVAPLWSDWQADISGSAAYTSDYQTASDNDPGGLQDSFTKINAAVHIGPQDGRFQLSVIGRNLTDEYVLVGSSARPLGGQGQYVGVFNRPREVVLQVKFTF